MYCKRSIRYELQDQVIFEALKRVHPYDLILITDHEIVDYYNSDENLYQICRRYRNNVKFIIHYLDEFMSIFLQSVIKERRRISEFLERCDDFKSNKVLMLPFIIRFPTHHMPAKLVIFTNQIDIVYYSNVNKTNTTYKIFQLGSVLVDRDSSIA